MKLLCLLVLFIVQSAIGYPYSPQRRPQQGYNPRGWPQQQKPAMDRAWMEISRSCVQEMCDGYGRCTQRKCA
ncbi:hypothetical protein Q1695_014741 [Nippostrongylus brasiliensis]|nr:hypothetical protein Q1695_014741 [Nippostrongylus brasiliensis]